MLSAAVEGSVAETSDLDWKRSLYNFKDSKWQDEIAKDIAAMANSGGGMIIFGVSESPDGTANEITPVAWEAGTEQRIRQVSYARISPPVLGIEFHEAEVDGGSIVGMRVPDSTEQPHLAKQGDNAFRAPLRNGAFTDFMTDRQIELAFRRRFQLRDERERDLETLFQQASDGITPARGIHLVAVAVPLEPSNGKIDEQKGQQVFNNPIFEGLFELPSEQHAPRFGTIRKGLRRWTQSSGNVRVHWKKQLHDEGTLQANYQLSLLGPGESAEPYYPVNEVGHCLSRDIERELIDFVATLRKVAQISAIQGGYRIRIGLVSRNPGPFYIRTSESQSNYLLPLEHSDPIYTLEPVTTDFDPQQQVDEWLPIVNEIALDLINQGGVRYLRIMRELLPPDQRSTI